MQHTFGSFLRMKRQEKNLTQKELADLLFVSPSAISKWEKDVAHPDITLLPTLSQILGVTEHELITASIDSEHQKEKAQAKKWRNFSLTWNLFWYIAYAVALIPCFICDLAINKSLTWFWIVLASLILAFTFTNLPRLIKKNKVLYLPLASLLALCLLLAVCCIYTNGSWFWIATIAILLGFAIVFIPIYVAKYDIFAKLRKHNDFVSIAVDFVLLNALLITINAFCIKNGTSGLWYSKVALPIAATTYLAINILLCVKFIKTNKLIKTSLVLLLANVFVYTPPLLIKSNNPALQQELNEMNILLANLSNWEAGGNIENNVHLIVFLTILATAVAFMIAGLLKKKKTNK